MIFLRTSLAVKGQNRFFDFIHSPVKQYIYPNLPAGTLNPKKKKKRLGVSYNRVVRIFQFVKEPLVPVLWEKQFKKIKEPSILVISNTFKNKNKRHDFHETTKKEPMVYRSFI
jgi:hypothetical protein